jgi:hypothetical protein
MIDQLEKSIKSFDNIIRILDIKPIIEALDNLHCGKDDNSDD